MSRPSDIDAWKHLCGEFLGLQESLSESDDPLGYIYLVRQPLPTDLYKIGYTQDMPSRLNQLSQGTGVALPFDPIGIWPTKWCRAIEGAVHASLDRYRVNPRREFFRLPALPATLGLSQDEYALTLFGTRIEHAIMDHTEFELRSMLARVQSVRMRRLDDLMRITIKGWVPEE